jgi:hypothetical protein
MMLGRRGIGWGAVLVKTNDDSAFAHGGNSMSAAPASHTARSARPKRSEQVDFIVNLDSGKIGAFKAILFARAAELFFILFALRAVLTAADSPEFRPERPAG